MRAEPVSALYELKRIHHVGEFADLETQLCTWTPEDPDSPDNLDALVWAAYALGLTASGDWASLFRPKEEAKPGDAKAEEAKALPRPGSWANVYLQGERTKRALPRATDQGENRDGDS